MRLITFIHLRHLIIQVQMTRDSLVWKFHTRQDRCLQLAVAAARVRISWDSRGGATITMLLFSFCLCHLALQPLWAHVFTSGLNYTATQLVEVMKPTWVFSLCLSRALAGFFVLFVLWSGFSKNLKSFLSVTQGTQGTILWILLWVTKYPKNRCVQKSNTFIVTTWFFECR